MPTGPNPAQIPIPISHFPPRDFSIMTLLLLKIIDLFPHERMLSPPISLSSIQLAFIDFFFSFKIEKINLMIINFFFSSWWDRCSYILCTQYLVHLILLANTHLGLFSGSDCLLKRHLLFFLNEKKRFSKLQLTRLFFTNLKL